jgi:hypothetical protein
MFAEDEKSLVPLVCDTAMQNAEVTQAKVKRQKYYLVRVLLIVNWCIISATLY